MIPVVRNIKYLIAFALVCIPVFSFSNELNAEFSAGNNYYQQKNYLSALKAYQKLIEGDHVSSVVYYNIGNCYYKLDSLGKAILYYERALKLNPDDEDISFNLKVASLKSVDKIETIQTIFYKRWFIALSNLLSTGQWSAVFLAMIWLTFICWGFYLYSTTTTGKKLSFLASSSLVILSILSFLILHENYQTQFVKQHAIILSASSYAKSAPDDRGNDQFILHEGTKVEVLEEIGTWKKIKIANGSVGWLLSRDIEII